MKVSRKTSRKRNQYTFNVGFKFNKLKVKIVSTIKILHIKAKKYSYQMKQ